MERKREMRDNRIQSMVLVAVFAAITYLGIQVFRIPMPAAVGTPFVHFGHVFVVMGIFLIGGKRGAVSGSIGLVVFDLLNGFVQDIPQVFLENVFKCLVIGALFAVLKKRAGKDVRKEFRAVFVCTVLYGLLNIVIEFVMGIVKMLFLGSNFAAAVAGSAVSIAATVINVAFLIAVILVIYLPVKRLYARAVGEM